MEPIHVVYMSISGHVRSFVDRLSAYAEKQHQRDEQRFPRIAATEILDEDDVRDLGYDFVMFIPTYVSLSPKDHHTYFETSTVPLRKLLKVGDNADRCRGLVGNGDRFFGPSYCLTSRQYAKIFHIPLLATYESRGTSKDIATIYRKMVKQYPSQAFGTRYPLKLASLSSL